MASRNRIYPRGSFVFSNLITCWATMMLAAGVAETTVMKIGGWKDKETMMIYVRMAGIIEMGATQVLEFGNTAVKTFDPEEHFSNTDYRQANQIDDLDDYLDSRTALETATPDVMSIVQSKKSTDDNLIRVNFGQFSRSQ